MDSLVSIVVPVYKVEQFVVDCLNSVVQQSYAHIECVIVNDATPDNSMVLVEDFIAKYKGDIQFRVVNHKINKGLSAARNTGVRASTGDYIFFLDSDDELAPNAIQSSVDKIREYGDVDFLVGNYELIGGSFYHPPLCSNELLNNNFAILNDYFLKKWYPMAWGKFVRKEFFIENDLWFKEGFLHEDEAFSFQLGLTANRMVTLPHVVVYRYRIHPGSISVDKVYKNYSDTLSIQLENIYDLVNSSANYNNDVAVDYFVTLLHFFELDVLCRSKLTRREKRHLIKMLMKKAYLIEKLGEMPSNRCRLKYGMINLPYLLKKISYRLWSRYKG